MKKPYERIKKQARFTGQPCKYLLVLVCLRINAQPMKVVEIAKEVKESASSIEYACKQNAVRSNGNEIPYLKYQMKTKTWKLHPNCVEAVEIADLYCRNEEEKG